MFRAMCPQLAWYKHARQSCNSGTYSIASEHKILSDVLDVRFDTEKWKTRSVIMLDSGIFCFKLGKEAVEQCVLFRDLKPDFIGKVQNVGDRHYLLTFDLGNRVFTLRTTTSDALNAWYDHAKSKTQHRGRSKSATPSSTPTKRTPMSAATRIISDAAAVDKVKLVKQIEAMTEIDVLKETKKKIRSHLRQRQKTDLASVLGQCERPCDMLQLDEETGLDPRIDPRIYSRIELLIGDLARWSSRLDTDAVLKEMVVELKEYYEKELVRFKEEGYEAARVPDATLTMVAENATRRLVPPQVLMQMDGGVEQSTGHSKVRFFDGIYWKQDPEFPGIEYAVDLAYKLVTKQGSPPSLLVKRIQYDHETLESHSILYQASQGVEGTLLSDMFSQDSEWVSKINPTNFCAMYILALLTLPQDGKGDNIIVSKHNDEYILTSIDNDHSFADPVCVVRNGNHFVNVKSILFCFPQAFEIFDVTAYNRLKSLSPEMLTVSWLDELHKQNLVYESLQNEGVFSAKEYEEIHLPTHLRGGTAVRFYNTLKAIQHILHTNGEHIMPDQIFAQLYPTCHAYYDSVRKSHRDERMNICELFSTHIFSGSYYEKKPDLMSLKVGYDLVGPYTDPDLRSGPNAGSSSSLSSSGPPPLNTLPIAQMLALNTCNSSEYEKRDKLPFEELEDLLQKMDLSKLSPSVESELVRQLCGFSYMNLTLLGSRSFKASHLKTVITNSPALLRLELHHCSGISVNQIAELAEIHRLRTEIVISGPDVDPESKTQHPDVNLTLHKTASATVYSTETLRKSARVQQYIVYMFEAFECIRAGNYQVAHTRFQMASSLNPKSLEYFKPQIIAILTKDALKQLIAPANHQFIKFLLTHHILDVNQTSSDGESPWHIAVRSGDLKLCELMLSKGKANPNARTLNDQRTPLQISVITGNIVLINKLLELKVDINALDISGHSALSLALISHYTNPDIRHVIVSLLLQAKPDLSIKYEKEDGNTALHLAIAHELIPTATALIEAKAPLKVTNASKETLMHTAAVRNEAFVKMLLKAGVAVDPKESHSKTPLMLATIAGNLRTIEALCIGKANANIVDEAGRGALTWAIDSANLDALKILISQGGADPNMVDIYGQSPMWRAASILYKVTPTKQRGKNLPLPSKHNLRLLDSPSNSMESLPIASSSSSKSPRLPSPRSNSSLPMPPPPSKTDLLANASSSTSPSLTVPPPPSKADLLKDSRTAPSSADTSPQDSPLSERSPVPRLKNLPPPSLRPKRVSSDVASSLESSDQSSPRSKKDRPKKEKTPRSRKSGTKTAPNLSKGPKAAVGPTYLQVAEYLLEHGGDLKKPNASGEYFAHYLARRICKIRNPQGCGVQELQFLINHSIPLDTLNENGDSALHLICATNIKDCDLAHANGLETAVSYFSTIVKMIFGSLTPQGRQALLFKENAEGLTPLHLSIRNGPELLPVLQEVNGLSAYLSTLSTKDHATKNPFILAIQGPVETFQGLAQWYETELKIHMKIISRAASHRKDILAILEKYQEK